ncbi:MAG: PIN domain-containing protein [Chloroflexota bacterium]
MSKTLVLDTNILLRAVFGVKVPTLLDKYQNVADYLTPEYCYDELKKHAFSIGQKRGLLAEDIGNAIAWLERVVDSVPVVVYEHKAEDAKNRIRERDLEDWPILALALALDCAVWTEDHDFFGTGVSTWNSRNIEIFLSGSEAS